MLAVSIEHEAVSVGALAHEVPELLANQQLVVGEELSDALLAPWFAFAETVVGGGKTAADVGAGTEGV